MKGNKLLSALLYGAIAGIIAVSGAGCIVTAFGFSQAVSFSPTRVDMQAVVLWCAGISLVSALIFAKKSGWVALLAVSAAVVGILAVTGMLHELYALAYRISVIYDKAYHWGTLPKIISTVETGGMSTVYVVGPSVITGGLVSLCALVILVINWVLRNRASATAALVAGLLPLLLCCVVADTVPAAEYLFLLLAGLILVVFSGTARRRSEKAGVQLTAMLMVPVLLASMLLSHFMPQEAYEKQSEGMLQTMLGWVKDLPFVVQGPDGSLEIAVTGTAPEKVDLTGVGPLTQAKYPVMDVVSSVDQRLYLRGQSFDTYDGKSWTNSDKGTGKEGGWPERGKMLGTVTVRTRGRPGYRYVPYYTAGNKELKNGAVVDASGDREYFYTVIEPAVNGVNPLPSASIVCMTLYDEIQEDMERIADWALSEGEGKYTDLKIRERKAKIIEEYVRSCAAYSLDTPKVPEDVWDFALWFLQNGETGYCTHFATAAALLLRAADIPARYVTGYVVDVTAGQKVTVTADRSHAWVEYLNDNNIWTVLDATPGEWMEETPTEPQTQPTEPTTEEPTAPTMPENTEPSPTGPSATRPNQPTNPGDTQPTQPGQQEQEVDRSGLWTALKWLAGILGALAAVAGQYFLRRQLRRRKLKKGSPNRQALSRWAFVKRMAKLIGQQPPEELYRLAEKAKFSQHTLTEEELARMDGYLERAQQALCKKPWLLRLALRLIWAV